VVVRCGWIALSMIVPAVGMAQPHDPVAAEALFREGRRAVESGDLPTACRKFAESYRLEPAPGTLLNLADCEERTGKLATAWQRYTRVAEQLRQTDERHALAQERAADLEKRLPKLKITAPPGVRVIRDDVELGSPSLGVALPVDPGPHVILVSAPDRFDRRYDVTMKERQVVELDARPGDAAPPPAPQTTSAKRTAGWIVGGAGLAALGAGAYFGLRALGDRNTSDSLCPGNACVDARGVAAYDDARTHARIADVAIGVGILAVATAAYLVITGGTEPRKDRVGVITW
jgi:hypothetical protein